MRRGELFVDVLVPDHCVDRGENWFRSVDAAKNSRVLDFTPNNERWPLVDRKRVKLSGGSRDALARGRIIHSALKFDAAKTAGGNGELQGDVSTEYGLSLHQARDLQSLMDLAAVAKLFGRVNYRIW